jgi:tight adherence protein B
MLIAFLAFLVVAGVVAGLGFGALRLPGTLADRRMERRLREVSHREDDARPTSFIRDKKAGPLPALDRALGGSSSLSRLVEQSGVATTPSTIVLASVGLAVLLGVATLFFVRQPFAWLAGGLAGMMLPYGFLKHRRNARMKRFEEQFPEALDLLSRAIRAGHAFQTAMGMCADELPVPVGIEFRKSFDQQNFGLPLKDALNELAERVPILDVKFFVTAVLIQRETGGNLAEILDNLAHVVRERFKILRQVRVHTAHGRFTGYVLLALPAALGVVLAWMNPDHMDLLFKEKMGQMMIMAAIVMQTVGYFWIRQVIKIEV